METPGNRLRLIRSRMKLTQKRFGEVLGLNWYQVKNMELGLVKITPAMAKLIHHETGYNTDWLLSGDGEERGISIEHRVTCVDITPTTDGVAEKADSSADIDSFTDRIKTIAKKVGGQDRLAAKSGIAKSTISKYALGLSDPTRQKLIALACAADVSIEWLVTGANKMDREPRDTALIFTLLKLTEEIVEYNKITITPEKKVKSIMYVYRDIKDEVSGFDYNEEKLKTKLCRYLDLAK